MITFKPDTDEPERCIEVNNPQNGYDLFVNYLWCDDGEWFYSDKCTSADLRQIADKIDELNKENVK